MEELITTSDFVAIASRAFCAGFIVGFSLWCVKNALRALSASISGRSTLNVD